MDASVLNTRMQFYQRFSTNECSLHRWIFDQLDLPPESQILELGCGTAQLWTENRDRIPDGWTITLSDIAPGMLREARQNLGALAGRFRFSVIDARNLPFPSESLDSVIANHMLYHIRPGRAQALQGIARVLRPTGRLYASTNARHNPQGLGVWIARFDPNRKDRRAAASRVATADTFYLENGRDQLARWFAKVRMARYDNVLSVTESGPLIANLRTRKWLDDDRIPAFTQFIEREIALHGPIRMTKRVGILEASHPRKLSP
jgi:ubiquinone/menaquinone biosynthesis C-methylase UbiE